MALILLGLGLISPALMMWSEKLSYFLRRNFEESVPTLFSIQSLFIEKQNSKHDTLYCIFEHERAI